MARAGGEMSHQEKATPGRREVLQTRQRRLVSVDVELGEAMTIRWQHERCWCRTHMGGEVHAGWVQRSRRLGSAALAFRLPFASSTIYFLWLQG
jgi:hypothetical protein